MPLTFLDRLPLPNMRIYSVMSVMLLSVSIYHAVNVTSDPGWKSNVTLAISPGDSVEGPPDSPNVSAPGVVLGNITKSFGKQVADVAKYMLQEPMCIWTMINMAYCCLFVLGQSIQRLVFGELRVSERQQVKDKFWNFVFYKFIFVFGVINVQYMDEVVLWVAWFTALGFLNILAQLCKDRFEYLSFSATSGGWAGARLAALLGIILSLDGILMILCVAVAFLGAGINTFAFMMAECVLLAIRTLHVIFRYMMHIMESRSNLSSYSASEIYQDVFSGQLGQIGGGGSVTRDRRAPVAHYTELGFDLAALSVDLAHHMHMLLWSNVFLSMASLVICMQIRYLFHEVQRKIRKHRNYLMVLKHMERNYPMATNEELADNSDNCAICWEKMETARKLPCGHLFHNWCLSSWLQQDTSCPTCRMGLSLWSTRSSEPPTQPRQPNHFFHFDGSRYVSWLPSFSVEVTHIMRPMPQATNSQIDAMARQVQQLFPHFPLSFIGRDLLVTHSVELTVENILDGRLVLPQRLVTIEGDQDGETPPPTPQQVTSGVWGGRESGDGEANQSQQPNIETPQDNTSNEAPVPVESTFSKCSHERERLFQTKKEQLLANARKKFLEKQAATKQLCNADKDSVREEEEVRNANTVVSKSSLETNVTAADPPPSSNKPAEAYEFIDDMFFESDDPEYFDYSHTSVAWTAPNEAHYRRPNADT